MDVFFVIVTNLDILLEERRNLELVRLFEKAQSLGFFFVGNLHVLETHHDLDDGPFGELGVCVVVFQLEYGFQRLEQTIANVKQLVQVEPVLDDVRGIFCA